MSKNKVINKQAKNIAVKAKSKGLPPVLPSNSNLGLFLDKYAFAISFGLIFLVALIVFKDFLFFKKVFLYKDIGSDTVNIAYPPMRHIADYIHTVGLPKWSFNYGMGQNIFPFFLQRDPFDIILFIIGKDNLAYGIGYIEFIKVISGGALFFLYLRALSLNSFTCIVGSLLYSFSGFMILGGGWYVFSFEAFAVALLLLAFEKLFRYNSWVLFPIAIALIGISMPFNLYVYGFFLAVYAAFRFMDEKDWNFKAFSFLYLRLVVYGLLGLGLSAVLMFGNVLQLIESPRGSGDSSYFNILFSRPVFDTGEALQNITAIMRLFSSDIMGTGVYFKGWQNYLEAPIFYCGLISLLLFPSIFQFLSKRKKIIYSLFLLFWILPVVFPFFRYAFWLFTGDYYRAFSFLVALTLLFLSLQSLNYITQAVKTSFLVPLITLILLLIILSYDFSEYQGLSTGSFNKDIKSFAKVILVIYAVLIYFLGQRSTKTIAKIALLCVLCIELGYFSSTTVNKRSIVTKEEFKSKEGYNDYTVEAVDYLKQKDNSFYRVDKNYSSGPAIHASINDGLAQDYRGTSSYNSFNQEHYILFLQAIGVVHKGNEMESRWAGGLGVQPISETIGSVKYFLAKHPYNTLNYDSIAQFGDVKVLRNKYYLPLGFTYDKFILRSDFDSLPVMQRNITMMKGFFINDNEKNSYNGFEQMFSKDTISNYTYDNYAHDLQNLKQDTLTVSDFGQNFIHGKIVLDKKKMLFLSIPYDKGWTAKVDGAPQEIRIVDAGMSGLLLDKGTHAIEMDFYPRLLKEGLTVSIISLILFGFLIWQRQRQKRKLKQDQ